METRFAGSQRLGDRRRRRLATESDESLSDVSLSDPADLPSAEGTSRRADRPDPLYQEESPGPNYFRLAALVPAAFWKHLLGAVLCLSAAAGIVIGGWYATELSHTFGPRIASLLSRSGGTVEGWYSSLLLGLASQLALMIWWVRSRSLKDFDGRYRAWTWIAAALIVFSFCANTGVHHLFGEAALRVWPGEDWQPETVAWLAPAALIGLFVAKVLRREMFGCTLSKSCFYTAVVSYVAAAVLLLRIDLIDQWVSGTIQVLAVQAFSLAGHAFLFLSMWLHARHVIHFSADPSRLPRRKWRLPRPHFRLPSWKFRRGDTEDAAGEKPAKRKAKKKSSEKSDDDDESPAGRDDSRRTESSSSNRVRIDAQHESSRNRVSSTAESAEESESYEEPQPARREPDRPSMMRPVNVPPSVPAVNEAEENEYEERDESQFAARPEFKGLSKKQRRRLMQELRERERSNRR